MKQDYKNIFGMLKGLTAEIIMVCLLYIGLRFLPNRSLPILILAIVTVILTYSLVKSIQKKTPPTPKKFLLIILRVSVVVTIFYYSISLLGGWGIIGLIIIISGFVIYRIWKQLKLFNNYTIWAARRLRGLTKEEFDFEKLKGDDNNE